jgi:DNA-binding MarR family transcriptional regulator
MPTPRQDAAATASEATTPGAAGRVAAGAALEEAPPAGGSADADAPAAADAPDASEREIAQLAGALVARIFMHYQARAAELSLSMPEAKALWALEPGRSLPMRELAARVHASPSNLTVTVDRLEARGLVVRGPSEDRRVKSVQLTGAGLALRRRLEARQAADHPAVRGLDAPQRAALLELLRALAP